MFRSLRSLTIAPLLAATLLGGCASLRMDTTVQAVSGLQGLPSTPSYRFERLPSQVGQPAQDQLEALADPVLRRAGLRRDDATPRYAVLVDASIQQAQPSWQNSAMSSVGVGLGGGGRGGGIGLGIGGLFPGGMQQQWYQRQVNVLLREIASGRVVFETHASSTGGSLDWATSLAAMLDAAMQGFPNPPPGVRRVDLNLVRPAAGASPAAGTATSATVAR
ncbi:MAG: hypothetical protein NVS2B4_15010 [Ramlibacter sp.]